MAFAGFVADLVKAWPTMDDTSACIICDWVNSMATSVTTCKKLQHKTTERSDVPTVLTAMLSMDTESRDMLGRLWNFMGPKSLECEQPSSPTSVVFKDAKSTTIVVDSKVDSLVRPVRPVIGFKTETVQVEKHQAHLFFNYTVLQYFNQKGAWTYTYNNDGGASGVRQIMVDVNDSRDDWVLTANEIRIPSNAFGQVSTMDMVDADHLTDNLAWTTFVQSMDALQQIILSTNADNVLILDVRELNQGWWEYSSRRQTFPLWWKRESKTVDETKTSIYISPEAWNFVLASKVRGWSHAWRAATGMLVCMTGIHNWTFVDKTTSSSKGYNMMYFSKEGCYGKTFVLENVPGWKTQTVVTAEQVVASLQELGQVVREKLGALPDLSSVEGMTCI